MSKKSELSALDVRRLDKPGSHAVGGVKGLYLEIKPTGASSWVFRATISGKRVRRGLGGYPTVTLSMARDKARELHDQLSGGTDPFVERQLAVEALANVMTFTRAANEYIQIHQDSWTNEKHRYQWRKTLEDAGQIIGDIDIKYIDRDHVLKVLKPMWSTTTETATRLRGRMERVLDWATVRGHREGPNPASWKGHLEYFLPAPAKIAKKTNWPALPYDKIHDFIQTLRLRSGMSAKALEFTILTAARSGEVRGCTWGEIDLDKALWTIPAHRMKMKQEHVQPLSKSAIALLERVAPPEVRQGLVFRTKRGKMLSDMALSMQIRRMNKDRPRWVDHVQGGAEIVPHGFRSTFRTWGAEQTAYPREVIEKCLAHDVRGHVERAYQRSEHIDARRRLLEDWAQYVERGQVEKVIQLAAR